MRVFGTNLRNCAGVPLIQPHLCLYDFFLFPKVKEVLEGSYIATVMVMQSVSFGRVLEVLEESAFQKWFESWKLIMPKYIRVQGEYIEGFQ